jgi:hypothetical protein
VVKRRPACGAAAIDRRASSSTGPRAGSALLDLDDLLLLFLLDPLTTMADDAPSEIQINIKGTLLAS